VLFKSPRKICVEFLSSISLFTVIAFFFFFFLTRVCTVPLISNLLSLCKTSPQFRQVREKLKDNRWCFVVSTCKFVDLGCSKDVD
jgi:hypothetical protein